MTYWLFVESKHNWLEDKINNFQFLGIDSKKFIKCKFLIGDKIVTYIRGEKKFADLREIVDVSLYETPVEIKYDRNFQYSLKTKSIIFSEEKDWIPLKNLIYDISIFKDRYLNPGSVLLSCPKKITLEDFLTIKNNFNIKL